MGLFASPLRRESVREVVYSLVSHKYDTPWDVSAGDGIDRMASHHASTARLLVMITPERPSASGPRTILSLSSSACTRAVSRTGTDSGTYPFASNAASYRSGPSSSRALSSNTYFIFTLDDDDDNDGDDVGFEASSKHLSWIFGTPQRWTTRSPASVKAVRMTKYSLPAQSLCLTSSLPPWSPPSSLGPPLRRSPPAKSGAPSSPLKSTSSTLASTSVQVSPHRPYAHPASHPATPSPSPPQRRL